MGCILSHAVCTRNLNAVEGGTEALHLGTEERQ